MIIDGDDHSLNCLLLFRNQGMNILIVDLWLIFKRHAICLMLIIKTNKNRVVRNETIERNNGILTIKNRHGNEYNERKAV